MDRQEILHIYGKSVYQIRLETALCRYAFASGDISPEQCLQEADRFIEALQAEDDQELQAKFP